MNKKEFMEILTKELQSKQNSQAVCEIIADINEHFDEAVNAGQSEAEVCAMLGDPIEIATGYFDELGTTSLSSIETQRQAEISISLYDANLVCKSNEQDKIDVQILHGNKIIDDSNIKITHENGVFNLVQSTPNSFVERLFRVFEFRTIVVTIPSKFQGNLYAKLINGNLIMSELTISKAVTLELSSGNVKLNQVSVGDKLWVTSRSGNISLENCFGESQANCRSGNIRVIKHSGSVSATCFSGNINIETDAITQDSIIETKSGNLRLNLDCLSADLNLSCNSGNIKFRVKQLSGNLTGKTKSGNITAYFNENVKAIFMLKSSGIHSDFPIVLPQDTQIPTVSLMSRHGNVKVKKNY